MSAPAHVPGIEPAKLVGRDKAGSRGTCSCGWQGRPATTKDLARAAAIAHVKESAAR